MQTMPSERYHALDSLRAVMMLLGVVLHALCAYVGEIGDEAWPFHDEHTSIFLGLLLYFVHSFRMPAFFVMAGFFAALLYDRRGMQGLIVNRFKRILLPLVVGWFILFPLVKISSVYAMAHDSPTRLAVVWEYCRPSRLFERAQPMHLWFLYDLLYFYAGGIVLVMASRCVPEGARMRVTRGFRRMVQSPVRIVILGLITTATLYPTRLGMIEVSGSFAPEIKSLLIYGVFFAFGWLLYGQADLLPSFRQYAWTQTLLALPICVLHIVAMSQMKHGRTEPWHAVAIVCGALIAWLLVFGFTGLFVRCMDRQIHSMRYLTDASYWVYLVHLPLIIWLQGLLANASMPAIAKFSVVLAIAAPILLVSYHYCVRATMIGQFLNGRRYPIGRNAILSRRSTQINADLVQQEAGSGASDLR